MATEKLSRKLCMQAHRSRRTWTSRWNHKCNCTTWKKRRGRCAQHRRTFGAIGRTGDSGYVHVSETGHGGFCKQAGVTPTLGWRAEWNKTAYQPIRRT